MFTFLADLLGFKKPEREDIKTNVLYKKLKSLYKYDSVCKERKKYLKDLIKTNGYLPYPYIQALEELTPAEILYGLEIKWKNNKIFDKEEFSFENENISPAKRAGYTNADWIKKEQHNIKLINLAGLGDGNQTHEPGTLIDWLRQLLILPSGLPEKNVLSTTIYLIPFHPREFGCAYLPTSVDVSPSLENKDVKEKLGLNAKEQVRFFIQLAQLAGHPVIYDVLPQTGRFSKMVLSNPSIARWYDISELVKNLESAANTVAQDLKNADEFSHDDIDIVLDLYKSCLKNSSCDLSEHYQVIYNRFNEELLQLKKEISNKMLLKEEQVKLAKRVKEIVSKVHIIKPSKISEEKDITKQGETIQTLIKEGLWPAPGGAWCSAGIPVFEKMSEYGDYPIFKHYDCKDKDVSDFANLDCQTPFYFVYLENGKFNNPVIDVYVKYLEDLQKDYNFDGFRVDHIDHIVDDVSEQDCIPISYRAPSYVLSKANKTLKQKVPHFAAMAEYMLWDKFYKEYHEDMLFDILWGDDVISQASKKPEVIVNNNHELQEYNIKSNADQNMSILKAYNNQDGEFRDIDQYPGQLGEDGAIFKWLKYKFLPGGKNASRPMMYIDGDESFTKTGIESVIGSEVSMPREHNIEFFKRFNAIDRFALKNELTREGEAEVIKQDDDGFVVWMVSKDPLKECLLVVANYVSPTEKISEENSKENGEGGCYSYIKERKPVKNKNVMMPCDYSIVSEYKYNAEKGAFEEIKFEKPETEMHFGKLKPAEFKVFKVVK